MKLYPIFLKLKNKACLVIGGGDVAFRKTANLVKSGALVSVIAPEITDKFNRFIKNKKIRHINRKYINGDLKDYYLVIAATNSSKINKEIYEESLKENILINCVDDPENSSFYVPSVAKEGDLQIAISTSGKAPLLAKKIREIIEKKFYPDLQEDIDKLSTLRGNIINSLKDNIGLKKQKINDILVPKINKILEKLNLK